MQPFSNFTLMFVVNFFLIVPSSISHRMALSRIWSAFILVAIILASYKMIFVPGHQDIFSKMVTGKSDDTYAYFTPSWSGP